jgi:hypothetical protein
MPRKMPPAPWEKKIVGYGDHAVSDLLANESNWRRHSPAQLIPLLGVLQTVGVVQNLLVNKRASAAWPETARGREVLVDGHARVLLAQQHGQSVLPVTYVELTPNEEAQILLMLDPLTAMAESDRDALSALLQQVQSEDAAVRAFLAQLGESQGIILIGSTETRAPDTFPEYDEDIPVEHTCPRCGYQFSGRQ